MKLYSIKDNKGSFFALPQAFNSDPEAIRALTTTVQTQKCQLSEFPEDFDLYHLGEFNQDSGVISPLPQPEYVIGLISLVKGK